MKRLPQLSIFWIGIIFLLLLPILLPLLHTGLFVSDDASWMVIRFSAFYDALRDGHFPVRWLERLNNGYGYPLANYMYPGFMYLGVPIHILGFGFVDTIKIVFALSYLGSAIGMYLWLQKLFPRVAAVAGAVVYSYLPYHIFDMYTRGSIGEVLALAVIPFVFWMIEKKNFFLIPLTIFCLILAHNSLALIFLPLIMVYLFVSKKRLQFSLFEIVVMIGSGVLMTSFFSIPAFFELPYTIFSQVAVSNPSDYFADVSLVGYSTLAIIPLTVFCFYRAKKTQTTLVHVFMILLILSILFATVISGVFWEYIPSGFIQFPFRLLSFTLVATAFLAAYSVSVLSGKSRWGILSILAILLGINAYPYLSAISFVDHGEGFYATNMATTTVKNEYMPSTVKKIPERLPSQKVIIDSGSGEVTLKNQQVHKTEFDVEVTSDAVISVNTIYFPGWTVYVNNKEYPVMYTNELGIMQIELPPGMYAVKAQFEDTALRRIANILSLVSFGCLACVAFWRNVVKKNGT